MNQSNIIIILARCQKNKQVFGIRFEETGQNNWLATWAFPINEISGKREGYDRSDIKGIFGIDIEYPGCPHCAEKRYSKCGCGKVACWNGETVVNCPWCGRKVKISGTIGSLSGSEDR